MDLLDAVSARLAPIGLIPLPFRETAGTRQTPRRADEFHKALEAEALVADFALALGSNALDEADLLDAARLLIDGGEPPSIAPEIALASRRTLETVRAANQERLVRAFGATRPTIILIARRESERLLMRAAINGLFGGAIDAVERQLPRDVHGARQDLPGADAKAKARIAIRTEAWRELAEELSLTYRGCHALVQAEEWYGKRHDDAVNKLAGRQTLATIGDANVQYLLPATGGWRGLAKYLHRVQSAVYDLMFGHSGLVAEIQSLLRGDFPVEATRPRAIIGISLVTQARLRNGAQGGQICLATRIDGKTSRTQARIGWFGKAMQWTPWLPFFDAMKRIATLDAAMLGPTEEAKRRSYQLFTEHVLDDAVEAGDRPLVLIDSTSAAGMWPWLTDARISGPITIGPESMDKSTLWASARLVRVRDRHAGRVLERKTVRYERIEAPAAESAADANGTDRRPSLEIRYCPTVTAKTVEIAASTNGDARHYWVTGGYLETMPRGLSVYRELDTFVPVSKVRGVQLPVGVSVKGLLTPISIDLCAEPYRVPNGLDVTVAAMAQGDLPDRIVHAVASLRYGYGHSRLPTTLPAPLFFETKARDYMARFAVDDLDADDDSPESAAEGVGVPEAPDDLATRDDEDFGPEIPDPATAVPPVGPSKASPTPDASAGVWPPAPPAPAFTGRWSKLLDGSLSVRLAGSTALSSGGPVAFLAPSTTLGRLREDTHTKTPPRDRPADGGALTVNAIGTAMKDLTKPSWIDPSKGALLPLPSFVTPEWLLPKISLQGNVHLLKEIHRWRQEIRDATGFPWPAARPEGNDIADIIVAGIRHPNFVRVLTRVAARSMDRRKRDGFHLFLPFGKQTSWAFDPPRSKGSRKPMAAKTRSANEAVRVLVDAGMAQDAQAMVLLMCLGSRPADEMIGLAREFGFSELETFLEAAASVEGDFDWQRDVIDQVDAPTLPPPPRDNEIATSVASDAIVGDVMTRDGDILPLAASSSAATADAVDDEHCPWNGPEAPRDDDTAAGEHPTSLSAERFTGATGEVAADKLAAAERLEAKEVVVPQPPVPNPGAASDVSPHPADAARLSWQRAMGLLEVLAAGARTMEPDPAVLREAVNLGRVARAALRAWEVTRTRLIDAWPTAQRARDILERLRGLQRAPNFDDALPIVAGPIMVERGIQQEAELLLDQAACALDEAIDKQRASLDMFAKGDLNLLAAMVALNDQADQAMALTVSRIGAATATLTDAVARLAQAPLESRVGSLATRITPPIQQAATVSAKETSYTDWNPPVSDAASCPEMDTDRDGEIHTESARTDRNHDSTLPEATGARGSLELAIALEASAVDVAAPELRAELDPIEDPGFEFVEAAAVDDELLADTEAASTALPPGPPPVEQSAPPQDPLISEIEAKLEAFIGTHAFGVAYHLSRAAAQVFPDHQFSFKPAELRLAAMSGRIGHGAMQESALLERVVAAAVNAVSGMPAIERGDAVDARRIILSAICAELAMFHPGLPAAAGMNAVQDVAPGLAEAFNDLHEAVSQSARLPSMTPALLRTVAQEAADDDGLKTCREAVLAHIEAFSKIHFNWVPANKIRANLTLRSGPIGMLREAIEQSDDVSIAAARAFAENHRGRVAIIALVEKVDRGSVAEFKGIDGAIRERMVSAIENLSALCAEYVEAADAAPSARNVSHKALVLRIAQAIAAGADKAVRGLRAFAASAEPLTAAAVTFAVRALTRLKDTAQGRAVSIGIHDHLLAVHGPLFWIPGLHYGSSWLPAPYQPEAVVMALLDAPVPPLDFAPTANDFREAVRARLREGSFIGARMLIQGGAFYGLDQATREAMAELCDADVETSRSALKDDLDATRGLVDKVQRMGGLVRIEQANAALAALDRIEPDALPSEVSLEARVEQEEPEQVMDICSARDVIADVRDRVKALMEGPRAALSQRLDALAARVRPGDIARVRELISDHDDLVTAGEYIGFLEDGGTVPATQHANRRFHDFFPRVPEALAKIQTRRLETVQEAIETGTDMEALPFSRVPPERRGEAIEVLEAWRDLRRRVDRADQAAHVQVLVERFLTAARLSPEIAAIGKLPNLPPKTYVLEARLTVPEDAASLLLPDFGSSTGFNYRICAVAKMPSEGELSILCREAGIYGVIILVASVVDAERRRQLAVASIEKNRRVLVLDEAIVLHALAEPEFRPLTMIECAQPFSFAAPYRDSGNAAVPPEMFFGRETEIRKIADRMGSCVVYGGRRLGKTALLRHVQSLRNVSQSNGSTVAGYVNIRDIGPTPSRIWDYASRELPAIFATAIRTPSEFTSHIRAWLDGDSKRQVLLLLDETDGFIAGDAKQQFSEFGRLQELMDGTARRFKFVLAGLHNVTRIVRTENSPLKQIASDPQRIGPLMDDELPDAERLVACPLSAMGHEFKNRSDIWRILSYCNYYPVLVQTFCAGLIDALDKETVRRNRPVWEITGKHVRDAIENEAIRREIGEKFDYTIREIDPRYELIACVVADRALHDNSSGRVDEGMSTVDVLDAVCTWWPQAFDHVNRLDTVKDLLDEMVGLGVLRQTQSGAWALRSHAILRLLGDEEHVMVRLLHFPDTPPPRPFDPRSMRRSLTLPGFLKEAPNYPCPLTMGQEHDLFAGEAHVSVVFGNTLSDIGHVAEALRSADPVAVDGTRMTVVARSFSDVSDLVEAIRASGRGASPVAIVVDARTKWDPSWLDLATRQRPVREGRVRLILVGAAMHALQWARDPRTDKMPLSVRVMTLQSWADAFLDHELGRDNLPPERFAAELRRVTGGFNKTMSAILTGFTGNADRFAARLKAAESKLAKDRNLLHDLGLGPPMAEVFRRIADWADVSGRIGAEEIREGVADALGDVGLTAIQVAEFGTAMGVLEAQALRPDEPVESRSFVITPLLRIALAQSQPLEIA